MAKRLVKKKIIEKKVTRPVKQVKKDVYIGSGGVCKHLGDFIENNTGQQKAEKDLLIFLVENGIDLYKLFDILAMCKKINELPKETRDYITGLFNEYQSEIAS